MWSQGERVSAPCFQLSSPPSRDDSRLCYLLSLGAHLPSRSGCCFGRSSTSSGHASASEQTAYSAHKSADCGSCQVIYQGAGTHG